MIPEAAEMHRERAGIDLGSVSVKLALLRDGAVVFDRYRRHYGRPGEALALMLSESKRLDGIPCAVTGSGSGLITDLIGARPVNEVVALSTAVEVLLPEVGSVVEMGGQDSKLLLFRNGPDGENIFDDFAMNSVCAAGTGAFLDQQATRLGLEPESMGREAELCELPPRIAGRCSVFAKSDMIHLQQIGTPVRDIVAGLCFAVARNFKSSIASGKEFRSPVAFVGGVAANSGMIRAFREVLGEGSGLFVPEGYGTLTAAGAALAGREDSLGALPADLLHRLGDSRGRSRSEVLPPFKETGTEPPASSLEAPGSSEVYLGIDVGSISTNVVALDVATGGLAAKRYLMTAGRPLEAVKTGLAGISRELPEQVAVRGVGTTGSGRYMVGDFVGADVVRNEITAQARAAVEIDPEVDTIFEIGGQDSKYISLRDGRVVDFEMNKVCAAGTGSFLEEQAERLGLDIRDFGDTALESPSPAQLGERCTVFMESDVVSHQATGTETGDIVGGLCYSIVRNYLHRVVGERRIGSRIFFQGGTAYNKGVVAAFNSVLGERGNVRVPPHHDVTGAIGAALLAREHMTRGGTSESAFQGFSLADEGYSQSSFVCSGCSNRCEIHRVELEDGRTLFYGGRCERYERDSGRFDRGRNHFPERLRILGADETESVEDPADGRTTVGLPRALWFWERYPFFRAFFEALGMRVVVSSPSSARVVHRGVENVAAETCFPMKIAHGHVLDLLDRNVDLVFLPSLQRAGDPGGFSENYSCPFVQGSPYVLDAGLGLSENGRAGLLAPVLDLSSRGRWRKTMVRMAEEMGFPAARARRACRAAAEAQRAFGASLLRAGREALGEIADDEVSLVVVARPYNSADTTVSIDIPEKLSRLGARVIPMDFLDLPLDRASKVHRNMYWHYGQRILAAALAIREDPRLNAVYLTNFGCGPDSFIQHVFDEVMGRKPYLTLEIDEHAADAGIITRCEAFLDSLRGRRSEGTSPYRETLNTAERAPGEKTLWIPLMSDASRMAAAAVRKRGVDARAIPPTCRKTVSAGREATTGKECYPSIITSGNMLRILKREDPKETAFFMGTASGPCRFGQYCSFQRLLLRRRGYGGVPVLTSSSAGSYGGMPGLSGPGFQLDLLRGIAAADVLHRGLLRVRPYEMEPGAADEAYGRALAGLTEAMESGDGLRDRLQEAAFELSELAEAGQRPLVYVFGEIYVRNDPYANGHTVDHIEKLGGEVLPTPLVEWFEYVSHSHVMRALARGRLLSALKGKIKGLAIHRIRSRMEAPFDGILLDRPALTSREILESARPYMRENPGGEAVLCVGAPLAYLARGTIDGAVNIFPFTCLPGTIVTAVSKRLRREHPELPWINLAFDGQEDTDNLARLEAFMHQVRGRTSNAGRISAVKAAPEAGRKVLG